MLILLVISLHQFSGNVLNCFQQFVLPILMNNYPFSFAQSMNELVIFDRIISTDNL